MSTYKNREMATAAFPVSATFRKVTLQTGWSAGAYNTRVTGQHVIIRLSDGTETPCCTIPHGHKDRDVLTRCATVRVAQINAAANIPEAVR